MFKIELELANNGIIKSIKDDNINGAGEYFEDKVVYDLENDQVNNFNNTRKFINGLFDDLGIYSGNDKDEKQLKLDVDWGHKHIPQIEGIKNKIKIKENEIKVLKQALNKLQKMQNDNAQINI